MITRKDGRVSLETVEDGVVYVAANIVKVIAAAGHPGHDREAVAARVLSDEGLDAIRDAYVGLVEAGTAPVDALRAVGVEAIRAYRRTHGF
ncbi:hypothetical protein [Actinomadura sp. WAC 06369]|uniref:hypothetical protein n=1 Tax=Actinomadura sp. WAC 06369 TaxID=2203193 RepID=UPI000F7A6CA4|nr:hypothetical protein [Actinomadura sp. WAC 06369]RSN51130.1 hypothetical protein DMH08_31385 [Actinomadura sp. WAC 06369]